MISLIRCLGRPRAALALLLAMGTLALGGLLAAASARTALPTREGHVAGASQAALARALAAGVVHPRTAAGRYSALLKLFRALGVGVYSLQTRAIVRGAERGPKDFYAYDFELRNLAYALGAGQRTSLAQLAAQLVSAGFGSGSGKHRSLAPDTLRSALQTAARRADSSPHQATSLTMLVVRDLGLLHKPTQDIAAKLSARGLTFDPVQTALIVADLTFPVVKRSGAHRAPDVGATTSGFHCYDDMSTGPGQTLWKGGLIGLGHVPVAAQLMDAWHAALLGLALNFAEYRPAETVDTAYGPPGTPGFRDPYNPGVPLVLAVRVTIAAKTWNENDVKCGALAGYSFPKGKAGDGVADIPINWSPLLTPADYEALAKHGTITFEPKAGSDGLVKTGDDGIAKLMLKPKDEKIPGLGKIQTDSGAVQPSADLVGPFGNSTAGKLALVIPRFTTIGWNIQFHDQNGSLTEQWTYNDVATVQGETVDIQQALNGQVPIVEGKGGTAPLSWTTFTYQVSATYGCPGGGEAVTNHQGASQLPGQVKIDDVGASPDLSLLLTVTPASYVVHSHNGCNGSSHDTPYQQDGGFSTVGYTGSSGVQALTGHEYLVSGWKLGAPGSDVYASKTIALATYADYGTLTLKVLSDTG